MQPPSEQHFQWQLCQTSLPRFVRYPTSNSASTPAPTAENLLPEHKKNKIVLPIKIVGPKSDQDQICQRLQLQKKSVEAIKRPWRWSEECIYCFYSGQTQTIVLLHWEPFRSVTGFKDWRQRKQIICPGPKHFHTKTAQLLVYAYSTVLTWHCISEVKTKVQ